MRNLLLKEIKLSASVLSFIFIAFGLMFFLPGYPVLCGALFVSLGIFQSFQNMRETNDILFSALLPVSKRDVVKGKYIFVCFIEFCGLILMGFAVLIRNTLLLNVPAYVNNALMNANCYALGLAFVIFGLFNACFVCGFFKTSYKFAKPFIIFLTVTVLTITAGETLVHIPGLEKLNAFGGEYILTQTCLLAAGIAIYAILTFFSYRKSCVRFEKTDL